ncbi:MAG: hypothetical protein LW806_03935 [Planctomycetaceae bacterium]|jgi:hypothetical protein|nr:hypothetical protein [Planctomycetaceae bacterium]
MSPRTIRLIAPLLAALVAVLGAMSPALGTIDASLRDDVTAARTAETSCCGDDCRCGASCPCVERDPSSEPANSPLAPIEVRGLRALCLAAPTGHTRIELVDSPSRRLGLPVVDAATDARPAGRELLARVSKWTT